MNRATLLALCLAATAACSSSEDAPPKATGREIARMPVELVSPPLGVSAAHGGPVCVLREQSSGTSAPPRYVVSMTTRTDAGPAIEAGQGAPEKVFFELQVETGDQVFDGLVTTKRPRRHSSGLTYVPPMPPDEEFADVAMSQEFFVGAQEVTSPLKACRLVLAEPDESEKALGGRQIVAHSPTPKP